MVDGSPATGHGVDGASPGDPVLAHSFGGIATHYEQFRPGPCEEAVAWYLPGRAGRVIDLGAGTGALSRLLVDRVDEVVAIEPDDRMRAVLADQVPGVRAVAGSGESMPVDDGSADAVIASTSWHWMDPVSTLTEVARVLSPGGFLGALWTGPDPDGPFLAAAREFLRDRNTTAGDSLVGQIPGLSGRLEDRVEHTLVIPDGVPFDEPEHAEFTWDIALDADGLVGLLGTFSNVITLPDEVRQQLLDGARRLLGEFGIEGDTTAAIAWHTVAWRTRPQR